MKKIFLTCLCSVSVFLCACGSPETLLDPYSEAELLKSSNILGLVDVSVMPGFAQDLAVVSVADDAAAVSAFDHMGESAATSALLVSADTNDVLYHENIYESLAPASLTKLMTALLVLKYGDMDDYITFNEEMLAVNNPYAQMCGFVAGDRVSVRDLFYCMLVFSGNDTANALAMYISGTIADFAFLMNEEARLLGATHTNYVNACGLDEAGHETCTYDLYLMFKECLKYPEFCEAIKQSEYTVNYTDALGMQQSKSFPTTNLYLTGMFEPPAGIQIFGGKTGTTDNAGTCLILYTNDDVGNNYIAVVLGSPDKPELYQQMSELLSIIQKN